MPGTDVPLDTTKLRRFIEHCPRNAVMVYTTGWHVMAAELLRRLTDTADWAQAAVDMYGYASDPQDPMHQLACRLSELKATLNKQKEPTKCDSPS